MQLNLVEAKIIVSDMRPERVPAGETFISEGDAVNTGFMVLLLQGEVLVENITVSRTKPVTTTVLGPGSLIGEMGELDTGPRSASCTASTDIQCAVLTRDALEALIQEQPALGAKFLLAVSARIAERYRETQKKLVLFARLAATMQQELDRKRSSRARAPGARPVFRVGAHRSRKKIVRNKPTSPPQIDDDPPHGETGRCGEDVLQRHPPRRAVTLIP